MYTLGEHKGIVTQRSPLLCAKVKPAARRKYKMQTRQAAPLSAELCSKTAGPPGGESQLKPHLVPTAGPPWDLKRSGPRNGIGTIVTYCDTVAWCAKSDILKGAAWHQTRRVPRAIL